MVATMPATTDNPDPFAEVRDLHDRVKMGRRRKTNAPAAREVAEQWRSNAPQPG